MPLRHLLPLVVAIAIFGVGHVAVPPGHPWGDDFAQYLNHAQNLLSRQEYATLNHIPNPNRVLGPTSYPPGLPVLLALPYRFVGLDIPTMQVLMGLFSILGLAAIYLYFYRFSGLFIASAVTLLVAASPRIWWQGTVISPYGAHLLFLYLTFYCTIRANQSSSSSGRAQLVAGILTSACLYIAAQLRTTGVLVVPALILAHKVSDRGRGVFVWAVEFLAIAGLWITSLYLSSSQYLSYLEDYQPTTPFVNLVYYAAALYWFMSFHGQAELHDSYFLMAWAAMVIVMINTLTLCGVMRRVVLPVYRKRFNELDVADWFFVIYLLVILLYPPKHPEYLIPVLPIVMHYALDGTGFLFGRFSTNHRKLIRLVFVVSLYVPAYLQFAVGPFEAGIMKKEATEMFAFIREETAPDAVVVFAKPRALALFTERTSSIWPTGAPGQDIGEYFNQIGATHVVLGSDGATGQRATAQWLGSVPGVEVRAVFENADFVVYEIVR